MMKEFGSAFPVEGGGAGSGTAGPIAGAVEGEEPISEEEEKRREEVFKKAWEDLMKESMDEAMAGLSLDPGTAAEGSQEKERKTVEGEDDFMRSVRQAQEKLKESEANLRVRS